MFTAAHACSCESLLLLLVGMLPHRTDSRDHSSQTGSFSKETLKPQCGQQMSPRRPRAHVEQRLATHSGAYWVQMLAPRHSGLSLLRPLERTTQKTLPGGQICALPAEVFFWPYPSTQQGYDSQAHRDMNEAALRLWPPTLASDPLQPPE